MKIKRYYIYLLTNKKDGMLYIGVTNDLVKRVCEHKNNMVPGFTQNHDIHNLVYYEEFDNIHEALIREKQMKKWKRQWKIRLIEKSNPDWKDLYPALGN